MVLVVLRIVPMVLVGVLVFLRVGLGALGMVLVVLEVILEVVLVVPGW